MFKFKSHLLPALLVVALSSQLLSCGYIIHPERRGQKANSALDWPIVGLDAIGLLFFIIPGVIAFAIDFTSGTIYLPANKSLSDSLKSLNLQESRQIKFDKSKFDKESLAKIIKENTNIAINLDDLRLETKKN